MEKKLDKSHGDLQLEHLTAAIGTVVHGLDLSDPSAVDAHRDALRQLLLDREVIFFRQQRLSPADQVRVSRIFGDVPPVKLPSALAVHPESDSVCILESKGAKVQATDTWHADLTYHENPPLATSLYACVVPAIGGDTLFSSMTAAYQSLDPALQRYLENLKAIHNWEAQEVVSSIRRGAGGEEGYKRRREQFPPVAKPVIIEHPITGKKLLYVNSLYNKEIVGLRIQESAALISSLTGLAQVPEWQVRFKWEPGSLAIWDNISTQHYAVNDYHPAHRKMHRVVIRKAA